MIIGSWLSLMQRPNLGDGFCNKKDCTRMKKNKIETGFFYLIYVFPLYFLANCVLLTNENASSQIWPQNGDSRPRRREKGKKQKLVKSALLAANKSKLRKNTTLCFLGLSFQMCFHCLLRWQSFSAKKVCNIYSWHPYSTARAYTADIFLSDRSIFLSHR